MEGAAPQQFLGRPAENASDSNCASFLEARLDLFWSEDWPALWTMVRAECDAATITQASSRTKAKQTEARIRKVSTRARAGERGRALAAARNAAPVQVTGRSSGRSKASASSTQTQRFPTTQISHIFTARIAEFKAHATPQRTSLRVRAPSTGTTSAPGWARQHLLSGHCFHRHCLHARPGPPIPARWSGHTPSQTHTRTLSTPHDVVHRLALKDVIAHKKPSAMAAAGPLHHGVVCRMEPTR